MVDVKTIIKWLTVTVEIVASSVLVFFFINSAAYLYKRYKIEKTIETVDWEKYENGLPMPWVIFCLKIPFIDPKRIMLTSEDFENNTHDPTDYIEDVFIMSEPSKPWKKATPRTKTVYSVFHGRCLVLMFDIMLKGQLEGSTDYINIGLKEPRKLFGYVIRPGEEIYTICSWFPNESPKPLEFPEEQGFYDVVVSYVDILDERQNNCVDVGSPITTNTQATCILDKAKWLIKKEKCTLPWHWKLIENDPENKFKKCNESEFLEPSKDPALNYLATVPQPNDACQKRCHRRVVNSKVVTTVSNAHECLRPSSSLIPCSTKEPSNGTVVVGFWFRKTDIKVISRVLKIDWTTLTANIGGAMGLYLGWGLLDIVLKMYHYLIKIFVFLSRYFLKTPIDLD